jgi:translocation and assembly module TamB
MVAAAVLAVALLPYWLGPVVRSMAPRFGASVGTYSTQGYGRFVVTDVSIRQPGVVVWLAKVEGDTPLFWAGRILGRVPRKVMVGEWKVSIEPGPKRAQSDRPAGWVPLRQQLLQLGSTLDRWLPSAEAGQGTISWPQGSVVVDSATWQSRTLAAPNVRWGQHSIKVTAAFQPEPDVLRAHLDWKERSASIRLDSRGAAVEGAVTFRDQNAPVRAEFPATGWLPKSADIRAENWRLTGADVGIPAYEELTGTVAAQWNDRAFSADVNVQGQPTEPTRYPQLRLLTRASGTPDLFTWETAEISIPGVQGQLSAPVQFDPRTKTLAAPAQFVAKANLAELPWVKMQGSAEGLVFLEPRPAGPPLVRFSLKGAEVGNSEWRAHEVNTEGRLDWPLLVLERAQLTLADGGRAELAGECNFSTREVAGVRATGTVGYEYVKTLIPTGITFQSAAFTAKASGPWDSLSHEGSLQVSELHRQGVVPAAVRLWWRGRGREVTEAEAGIQSGATEIVAAGAMGLASAEISKFVWRHAGEDRLALERPARLRWGDAIVVEAVDLVGKAGELRLSGSWGRVGEVRFFARGISAEWWRNFVPRTPFEWSIDSLSVTGKWSDSPANFNVTGLLFLDAAENQRISLDLNLAGDGEVVRLERLRAVERGAEFARLTGAVPLSIRVAPKPEVTFSRSSALHLEGFVSPDARWWTELGSRSGLHLHQPMLNVRLRGSAERPEGEATLRVARIEFDERHGPKRLPRVENIAADAVATGEAVELRQLSAAIQGEVVTASGSLPMTTEVREKLRNNLAAALAEYGKVRVKAEAVNLAAFESFLVEHLLPQGRVDIDVGLDAKSGADGYVRVEGVATRPMGAAGPLRDIQADLRFEGRTLKVNRIEAGFGGQPVVVQGQVHFPEMGRPQFDLSAKGTNLPFVRQAGMVMRGDVDLTLKDSNIPGIPVVGGRVNMHDGFFVSDVRAMIPSGGGAGPQRRPPYFSVSAPPFNRWRLDVNLEGERFLRARTALFVGVASMKFHLVGTLENPRALGAVRIDEGQVLFPFARFTLQDASIRLTEENPYDPQLGIFGTSRRYGYDLKLELTGSASTPQLEFSSSPPLNSEQVLLLVMAGETPRQEVNYTASQRFRRIGTFFGQSILGSLSGGGGGEDRLTITSGERISRQGRETYNVEYELDDRWSLVGEYDEFDEYNAGVKWQLLPRPKKDDDGKK